MSPWGKDLRNTETGSREPRVREFRVLLLRVFGLRVVGLCVAVWRIKGFRALDLEGWLSCGIISSKRKFSHFELAAMTIAQV